MLRLPLLFQDHMVIQCGKKVVVWGTAEPAAVIYISMQGKEAQAEADLDGKWKAVCGSFEVSFKEEMVITSGREKIVLKDVQVGEVWLAAGQSNMEFHMRYDADMETERLSCVNDAIRFFDYPEVSYVGQIDEADYGLNYGFWRKAEPEQLERFSAVGYYFAKDIQNKLNVPVGIIGCNWGGTPACAWMSREAIIEGGGQVYLDEYEEAISKLDLNVYDESFRNNPASWQIDLLANPINDLLMSGCTMEEFGAKLVEMGVDLSQMDASAFAPQIGPKYERRPCGLYESMLKSVVPYTIRGIIWYQGETDGDCHPEVYKTLFPALIKNWRKLWNEELPFLFVQIAPFGQWMTSIGEPYIQIRDAQQYTSDTVPETAMAVISDVGMQYDIHPKKKQPVGHRLALLAENKVYGEDVLCEAPTLSGARVKDGSLTLTFENAGDGLYLADKTPDGQIIGMHTFGGLQVFQNNYELNAEKLTAKAEKNQVIISGVEIKGEAETEVRIAKTDWYVVNLYNSANIPARPANITI